MPGSNSDARKRHEDAIREALDADLAAGGNPFDAAQTFVDRINTAREMKTTIIGLSGFAQSGKDSTATVLEGSFGFGKLAFAEKLRSVARQSNPVVRVCTEAPFGGFASLKHEHTHVEWFYQTDPENAYEWLKANTTYRQFLQDLGTAVRDHLGELTWVNAALDLASPGGKYVVTDVRYKNEAEAIVLRGGQVWRVKRAGHGAANDHISEHDLDDWKFDRVLSMPDYADDLAALYEATYHQVADLLEAVS